MLKGGWRTWVAGLFACLAAAPAAAAVDGEVELRYWGSESDLFSTSRLENVKDSTPGAGLRAEIVLIERLAIAGEYGQLNGEGSIDGSESPSTTSTSSGGSSHRRRTHFSHSVSATRESRPKRTTG